jgi:hypothetical protein
MDRVNEGFWANIDVLDKHGASILGEIEVRSDSVVG